MESRAEAMMPTLQILCGDALDVLKTLPSDSVHCCVTSPPYWGLRDYGTARWDGGDPTCDHSPEKRGSRFATPVSSKQASNTGSGTASSRECPCGAHRVDSQIGLEPTLDEFLERLAAVFEEVRRVLHPSGVCFVDMGDSYNAYNGGRGPAEGLNKTVHEALPTIPTGSGLSEKSLKPKDRCLVPFRLALLLQARGWWVRDIICWCLSGGAWVYAKTQKGEMPMMVRDIARLKPGTVKLWNGEKWTQVLGWSRSASTGAELELVLRSGERISCTPNHQFPTDRGLLPASELKVGDVLKSCRLPQPELPYNPGIATADAAWFVGLYLAEGYRNDDNLVFSGHIRETARWERIQQVAKFFGGSATITHNGNNQTIRVYGRFLIALVENYVNGTTAKNKSLKVRCWSHANIWLMSLLEGYLEGDGHWDDPNNRWRIGFTRNYALERDLRVLASRLEFTLTLNLSVARNQDGNFPAFKGEIRLVPPSNKKAREEIVEIRKARCREVYDIGVADEPHLFALASGILTHNSKPAPMPESVTDRCTQAWEPILMLTKSARYFFDPIAIAEPVKASSIERQRYGFDNMYGRIIEANSHSDAREFSDAKSYGAGDGPASRNPRNVWPISPEPFTDSVTGPDGKPVSHFAAFPSDLPRRCILAATSARGVCPRCLAPWTRAVEPDEERSMQLGNSWHDHKDDLGVGQRKHSPPRGGYRTSGWLAGCTCGLDPIPATVLDPFAGTATTLAVALELGRHAIGIELNPQYIELARTRCAKVTPGLQLA